MKPLIHRFRPNQKSQFNKFLSKYKKGFQLFDFYKHFTIEKYLVETPSAYFSKNKSELGEKFYLRHTKNTLEYSLGNWIVFPWRKEIYHLPEQRDLLQLRTARNRGLLTPKEQNTIYNKRIALVGLSVGSGLITSLVRSGAGNYFRIADFDTVDPHNINRAPFFLRDVGKKKIDLVSDQLYSIDPYISIDMWDKPVTSENIDQFLEKVDLVVDCFDEFKAKILLKKRAKKLKIPVLSGFNISRGAMVITERYDLEPNLDLKFYLNGFSEEQVFKPVKSPKDKTDLFVNIIGRKNHDSKMLKAVYTVGTKLSGYPQLMIGTSAIAAMWTIAAIDILLGNKTPSLRKYIDLEKAIYHQPQS